ncbi:ATP-binding protein [Streptomyces virginiae]|uniref:ATP-binding protein n=1 Tax=Streptomyces virginiae TaxID=1961 RepID=UPI0030D31970
MGRKASGRHKSSGKKDKQPRQGQASGTSFVGASFERSQVLGSGTQTTKINVQAYAAVPTALNSLPGLPQEFTGRDDELAKILSMLGPGSGTGAAVGSIAGLPGVGKTTLAHAVGHAALDKGWFTGVQLVNLRGYDPTPVPPEDALEALLRALGVAAEHIPPTLNEREGLYRSQLEALAREEQRFLILADNASTSEQVRPLLPARHHAVLVTSRHALPGLGARLFNLHSLQPDAAVDLLRQRLEVADPDDRRVEDEPTAADELAALCGYLPLALQIAAALLADDPDQPLSERVRMLADAGTRLGGLDDGERNLRAVFDECLTRLSHQEADLYRLLGLHPGPDISTPAAAALTGQPADKITPLSSSAHACSPRTARHATAGPCTTSCASTPRNRPAPAWTVAELPADVSNKPGLDSPITTFATRMQPTPTSSRPVRLCRRCSPDGSRRWRGSTPNARTSSPPSTPTPAPGRLPPSGSPSAATWNGGVGSRT